MAERTVSVMLYNKAAAEWCENRRERLAGGRPHGSLLFPCLHIGPSEGK
jgi:hypothetical protein